MRVFRVLVLNSHKLVSLSMLVFSCYAFAGGPDIPPQEATWTGSYLGGNSGYARGSVNQSITFQGLWPTDGTGDNIFLAPFADKQLKANAYIGGIQAGYNYQISNWVPGVVMDFDYLGLDKNYDSGRVFNAGSGSTYIVESSYKTNWLMTIRPRVGYSFGSVLPYLTGGLAVGREKYSQTITQINIPFLEKGTLAQMEPGWTVGGGADFALAKSWQLMAEYLYVHLRSASVQSIGSLTTYNATHSAQLNAQIVRLGINYVFK